MKLSHSAAVAAVLLAAGATPAFAQAAPDWSGFYIGVHGGFLDTDEDKSRRWSSTATSTVPMTTPS